MKRDLFFRALDSLNSQLRRVGVAALALLLTPLLNERVSAAASTVSKPVFLYSRHFNAAGEERYLPDGTYADVLKRLRDRFEVRADNQPLTTQTLAGVSAVLIANPSDKAVGTNPPPHHFSPADIRTLTQFVRDGGGLIIMGNQENHNLEIEDTNKLLAQFGIQFTNLFTDAKKLTLPKDAPVIGGLRWAYYTGNLLLLDAKHPAKPRPLVTNDLAQKPLAGNRDTAGALMAGAELGKGRVVVVTDAGWIIGDALSGKGIAGVAIAEQDNWEIFLRVVNWAGHVGTAL